MDKTLKTKWIKALESGRYEQTQDALYDGGGYCCLGVLRKVMHPKSQKAWITPDGTVMEYLCKEHQQEAGLTKRIQDRLSTMNDNGKTFKEIAAWIRAKL